MYYCYHKFDLNVDRYRYDMVLNNKMNRVLREIYIIMIYPRILTFISFCFEFDNNSVLCNYNKVALFSVYLAVNCAVSFPPSPGGI